MKKSLALMTLIAVAGCTGLTHRALDNHREHMDIRWHADLDAAEAASKESDRPVLLLLVAGDPVAEC